MSAYIVREIGTDQLVGFVEADSIHELFWLVDEATDPFGCEYKRITNGGILWQESCCAEDEGGRFELGKLNGVSLSEGTVNQYVDNRFWKRFEPADRIGSVK